ncbi:Cytochrome b5 domain-containing protein [Carpediemonas membranifera]|uniref:Cytochrome b5 domain-containing protein 1 n=1 Tax=Carpediemonas membranifera TaxID=201153 RepID=A0A8J6DXB9_9EUKA|nr:Cytochrome b5 domain-containing protein [Carpediemonas membranifera]|eukprot:KAG9389829.1 Cytochrome b5 domain-containing protein [Carpediemonas membranifera]
MATDYARHWYTMAEVATHNTPSDCYVTIFGKVLNLTTLLSENQTADVKLLIENAGSDISHWFDQFSGTLKTYVDPASNIRTYHLPMGPLLHAPPLRPGTDIDMSFAATGPWWRNKKYVIGELSKKTRKIKLVNTLTGHEHVLEVPSEESVGESMTRYLAFNKHAFSYAAKHAGKLIDLQKTLEDNGVVDDAAELEELGMNPDEYLPCIHLYWIDDLSVA